MRSRFLFLALGATALGGWTLVQAPETPISSCGEICSGTFGSEECVWYHRFEVHCSDESQCTMDDDGCWVQ